VWALSPAAFGTFVAGIPAPLGIGTLRLADGTAPKGFLVETAGLAGATDITRFGGWRAYLAGRAP
jgi:allophanate hydrolase